MTEITLAFTWDLATKAHGAQKDKQGNPYSDHLAAVWQGVRDLGGDVLAEHVAILHDTIEDTSMTYEALRKHGYCEDVLYALTAVTKKSHEQNTLYIGRIIEAGDRAMIVKLADLYHNVREDRITALPEATQARLKYKYYHAISRIEAELDIDYTISDEEYAKSQEYKAPVYTASSWTPGSKWDHAQQKFVPAAPISSGGRRWDYDKKAWVDGVFDEWSGAM